MGVVYQGLGGLSPPWITDEEGITALVEKYANVLNINRQLLLSEMELFASTDTEMDINNVMQEQLKDNSYPQYYKIVQLALTLPEGSTSWAWC